ncbi:MAG: NAD(P)/FAD-dependent oxidoreductase [Geminicoccales bacterium]
MSEKADVIIIGAGIAGASLAFELAKHRDVVVLEWESQPGYHSTGRSAAMLIETYGSEAVQGLTRQSRVFFENPPSDFAKTSLLSPRGYLHLARTDQQDALSKVYEAVKKTMPSVQLLNTNELCALAPLVDHDYAEAGLFEPDAMAIDAAALHQGYLQGFARQGGRLITYAVTTHVGAKNGGWEVVTASGSFEAPVLVNAAGAWADQLAVLARVETIGLVPKRRTAILLDPPDGADTTNWPMVSDIDNEFYVKPEGTALMVSPADETPVPPSDAQPEELDVAIAVDRFERLTGKTVRSIRHRWAGLRSFVTDHSPIVGFDTKAPGFFWLAGQGGFGIMTAPAIAQLAASLIMKEKPHTPLTALTANVSPKRLKTAS